MKLNEYQDLAGRTRMSPLYDDKERFVAALGLCGEAGEFGDLVKKIVGHGHEASPETQVKMLKELGDVLWYVADNASAWGFTLEFIAQTNIEKLKARYPQGFTTHASVHRQE